MKNVHEIMDDFRDASAEFLRKRGLDVLLLGGSSMAVTTVGLLGVIAAAPLLPAVAGGVAFKLALDGILASTLATSGGVAMASAGLGLDALAERSRDKKFARSQVIAKGPKPGGVMLG